MNTTSTKIIEAANAGNWAFFDETFTYGAGDDAIVIDLDWAIDTAALTIASAIQLDDRYAALTPEAGYDALAGDDAAARDDRVREAAIAKLAYDREHKGY